MYSEAYQSLSKEGKRLVDEAIAILEPNYDDATGMIVHRRGTRVFASNRGGMYYALALLMKGEHPDRVEKLINAVIDTQIDAPEEVFHGVYRHLNAPEPRPGKMDYKRLGTFGRYFTDLFYEQTVNAFRQNLVNDPELAPLARKIENHLNAAVVQEFPIVWTTYEPNSREFILMVLAMLVEHFEKELSPETVKRIDHSAALAVQGAIDRSRSNFAPLNTNIQIMHVFVLDYFGVRHGRQDIVDYALEYAEKMVAQYLEYHAVAEFNSPTYCGVDLATIGYWRRYGSSERLKELGEILETGIWRDEMEFYNPAMRNLCGPFSRSYELEMSVHTHFLAMLYWALGEEKFPWPLRSTESDSNALLVLGGVNLPEDVKRAVFEPKKDVKLYRQFRELSERGDPANNNALCTATGWISEDLMTGALAGSENPSHQLHPLVVYWRGPEALGTVKVLRRTEDGVLRHLHTVYFNGVADREHVTLDVDVAVNRDVTVYYEIEYPGVGDSAVIEDGCWKLPGLRVRVDAQAPECFLERKGNILRVCYLSKASEPETKKMRFDLHFDLVKD